MVDRRQFMRGAALGALAFTVGLYEPRGPDPGCADGPLVFRSPPCTRAAPSTPPESIAGFGAPPIDIAFAVK